jgi:hypothetical protein
VWKKEGREMWKVVGKPVSVPVTKELIAEWRGMKRVKKERPLTEKRVGLHRKSLREGTLRPVTWSKVWCEETGEWLAVNGKHTAEMLWRELEAGNEEVVLGMVVTLEEYWAETLEDVARLYATFDSRVMMRTAGDINASFAGTLGELTGVGRQTINLAVAGMAFHEWPGSQGGGHKQATERAELMLECPEFVVWLDAVMTEGGKREGARTAAHLRRRPAVAAMYGSWKKDREGAGRFWRAVRDETGATPALACRRLARYLRETGVDTGNGSKRGKRADPREMYVKCIHAWNAWRRGVWTALQYHADAPIPAFK